MSTLPTHFVYPVLEHLKQLVVSLNTPDNLDGLIALHFDTQVRMRRTLDWCNPTAADNWAQVHRDAISQAPKLATLGALLDASATIVNEGDKVAVGAFLEGVGGLQKRRVDFSSSTYWALQPNIVLAIGLGIRIVGSAEIRQWFAELVSIGIENKAVPLLPRLMYAYILRLFDVAHPTIQIAAAIENLATCSLAELALGIWLARHEVGQWSVPSRDVWLAEAQPTLIQRMLTEEQYPVADYKAAVIWQAALDYLHNVSIEVSSDRITEMLNNFPAALERWKHEWRIEDEIDIQRLVFLSMRTVLEDVRFEDNLPKLGRSGHRYDIGIPALKQIIEIKYARKSSDFQKFVDEIGKDVAQLHTQSTFTTIIVFIYDTICSSQNHAWTRQELLRFAPVRDVVIVCAPSNCR
ncbi:MAG: hypothetical protein J0M33_02885 [Anaerolineae bacterium]|nr:hypothetical protein [Anaerolineae bacterium]